MSEGPVNEVSGPNGSPLPPVGSTERLSQQLLAEALLTNDGRVTDTPEAKTVAIEALAQRMRSSTPALVLASMGLVVGNDMASHLGNDRYVLVPYNDRYPSMGADVLHVDEISPADPRHAAERVVSMDSPQADTLVRMIAVSELMGSWAYGSNNNVRVLALQHAAQEEFGLTGVLEWHMDSKTRFGVSLELDYNRDTLRDFLRTQYEMTQEVLATRGITEVLSYRALSWPENAQRPDWAVDQNIGQVVEARQRPLASWSADRQIVADWLEERRGSGVILAAQLPARGILSLPMTGMGYLGQKEWVALPGDHRAVLDGIVSHTAPAAATEQSAAATVSLGAPALAAAAPDQAAAPIPATDAAHRWRPLPITQQLNTADPLDDRINRILDGAEPAPSWWPQDDSGYAITRRDLDFLGISPIQIRWLLTGEAPMGMTPELYQQFGSEMLAALERDGIDPSQIDIRLKGTGAGFFSGIHKTLPREADVADNPLALQRLREWFGDDQNRPLRRPYDAMWRLGVEPEPSDFDLDINSTAIIRAAREYWRTHHSDRYPGDFMGGHGYLDKQTVTGTLPNLAEWASTWQERLGRPLSLGMFESTGPFDATVLGRALSSHFKDTDWIIHRPDTPMAWQTPRSRISSAAPTEQADQGDSLAQLIGLLQQVQADVDVTLDAEARERQGQDNPLATFTRGITQLSTEVDPPGAPQPTPDLGLTVLEEVEQAYAAASQHAREYNGAQEWRQLTQLWQNSQQVWSTARTALALSTARQANGIRAVCRNFDARVADGVARLSRRLAVRLAEAGHHGSPGHHALRWLSGTAENAVSRPQGPKQAERNVLIEDTLRDLGTQLRAEVQDTQAGQQTMVEALDNAIRLVDESFAEAERHTREYNGAPEWRRLTSMWPVARRVLGEAVSATAAVQYSTQLSTDVRWQEALRTVGLSTLESAARLSYRMAERLANAGREDSPGHRAIQGLGHTAQHAASEVREDSSAERVATLDRFTQVARDVDNELADILGGGPGHGTGAGVPLGEPSRPVLTGSTDQKAESPANGGNTRFVSDNDRTGGTGIGE